MEHNFSIPHASSIPSAPAYRLRMFFTGGIRDPFERDDHNVAALMERPDGKILAVYGKHSADRLQRWRITTRPGDISEWSPEQTLDVGDRYSYSKVYRLAAENASFSGRAGS